ncbi:MAG: hypothetical protein E7C72_06045 [Dialister sp.]|nr:hypothetical protein [Dialister sp.]
MDHTKSYSRRLLMKGKLQTSSRPRLSGSKRTTFRGVKRRCKSE